MTSIDGLQDLLRTLRRQRQRRLALEGAGAVLVAIVAALLVGALITRSLGVTAPGVLAVRVAGYALVLASAAWFLLRPLLRRASDAEFALYVEERAPGLRQALLTAIEQGQLAEGSSALTARVVDGAARQLRPLAERRELERPREVRALRVLALSAGVALLALAFGPGVLRDVARVLFAPWSIAVAAVPPAPALALTPGDVTVPRGGALDVRAELANFRADGAELAFRSDSASDWIRVPMGRDADAFTGRIFDIVEPMQYYVEANGVRSRTHRIRVSDLPAVRRLAVELHFPAYTGREPERDEDGGDIAAVTGTTVYVEPTVTRPVREGSISFDDGSSVPLTLQEDGSLRGSFRVKGNGFYRVDLVSADGRRVAGGVQYAIEALDDRPPSVRIVTPGRDSKVNPLEEVTIEASASDDYGVRGLELRYRVNGGAEQRIPLRSGPGTRPEVSGVHTLYLEEMTLRPGDLVAYNAVATDATGQEALSDVYFLEIRPYGRDYRQAESGGQQGGMGQGEEGSAGDFVQRQREIVAGTYNWIRDSLRTPPREKNENATTLAIAQGQLREEVATLARRLVERGVASSDSTFKQIQATLDSAVAPMRAAEERLGKREVAPALPSEERALAFLQRADALYRDVQLQRSDGQQGGGGGGGQQPSAEDLADLFELETDRLRNQYESVQQQSAQQQTREVDETLERLRQLASRQQQENERLQRQAEAMRERMGREASGGGGGAQRQLAQQAEEEARRLERLSRERQSEALAEAARQMQRAADAMRQAATGSEAQGSAALEQLERAAQRVEDARSQGLADGVRALADRARQLEERQRAMARDVQRSTRLQGAERSQELNRLNREKEQMAAEVEKLEADADRLSREARREQPNAAGRLREASDGIRDQRVRDKIQFSRNLMRSGSPDYIEAFEGQIAENLAEASERMRSAVGALTGESAARQQARAREQARALVQGAESLAERLQGQGQQGEGQQGAMGGQGGGNPQGQGSPRGQGQPNTGASVTPNDPRQLAREFGLRRQNAEELRNLARSQGVDVRDLDRAIRDLRQLESGRALGDARASAALQAEVLERLRAFEFTLNRQLAPDAQRGGALGARSPVPTEYRAEVEEYYRSLARPRP